MKSVPKDAIVLDTDESQECHAILDWMASKSTKEYPCPFCDATVVYNGVTHHFINCMGNRAFKLINSWAH